MMTGEKFSRADKFQRISFWVRLKLWISTGSFVTIERAKSCKLF